ncbi:MAG: mobilization protein [Alphaproteobacteria bacterium]|nr:MAG: mobilization protein [Alphaproteobacteria bacterium]
MKTIEERITEQEAKLRQLKAKQQKLLARKRTAESRRLRADDTRRKILLGAMLMQRMTEDENVKNRTLSELGNWLSRDDDRELFSLARMTPVGGRGPHEQA